MRRGKSILLLGLLVSVAPALEQQPKRSPRVTGDAPTKQKLAGDHGLRPGHCVAAGLR
jgi:hypothetical protein